MPSELSSNARWATLAVWVVVNAVNLLQTVGFLSRVRTGTQDFNHLLGYVIIGLAIPAAGTLVAFLRARAAVLHWLGLVVFLAFIVLMVAVDYVWSVEFRNPARNEILIPYLLLFFGAILLMGLPMYRLNRALWLVTVVTTVALLTSMIVAMRKGVG